MSPLVARFVKGLKATCLTTCSSLLSFVQAISKNRKGCMYKIEVSGLVYKYIVGSYSAGIISPSGKKHLVNLRVIRDPEIVDRGHNGSSDDRLMPSEVAAYVLKNKLL